MMERYLGGKPLNLFEVSKENLLDAVQQGQEKISWFSACPAFFRSSEFLREITKSLRSRPRLSLLIAPFPYKIFTPVADR